VGSVESRSFPVATFATDLNRPGIIIRVGFGMGEFRGLEPPALLVTSRINMSMTITRSMVIRFITASC